MFKTIQSILSDHNQRLRILLMVLGFLSFMLGLLYYWFLRETPPFLLQYFSPFREYFSSGLTDPKLIYPDWFYSVPSFIHVVSFSFFTLAVVPLRKRFVLVAPLVWLLINISFEVSQALADYLGPLLSHSKWSIFQVMHLYSVNGTYAISDIVAAFLGILFVYFVVYKLKIIRSKENTKGINPGYFHFAYSVLLVSIFTGGILSIVGSYNCEDSDGSGCYSYYNAEPIYMSYDELRTSSIVTEPNRALTKTGKIYLYQNYMLINSPNEGVHIYDNTDPSNPIHITFINIPGNLDIAIKQDYLYVDSYIDLVSLDISDMTAIREVHRVNEVFPYNPYQNIPPDIYLGPIDINKGVVIGYILNE